MNSLSLNTLTAHPIEWQGQRVVTTSLLAEFYNTMPEKLKKNYNNNKSRFVEERHYYLLEGEELRAFKREVQNLDVAENVNKLYLWTKAGTLRHAKSLGTDEAWEVYDILEETYFQVDEMKEKLEGLSPELKFLISVDLRLTKTEEEQRKTSEQIDGMRNIVALNPTQWRVDTGVIIKKAAQNLGGNEYIKVVHNEAYDLLEQRFGVSLGTRLTNKRRRMADEGVCKSRRDKLNQLDVIADDKKLVEGYVAIVKELAIKYGVGA